MISKKTVADDAYCESYDEIMYKLMILSGTIEKRYHDTFKPSGVGVFVLGETFSLKTSSIYLYYSRKLFSLPMVVVSEMIISHYDPKDPILEKIKHIRNLIKKSFKNYNAKLTELDEKSAKDKFIEKWSTVDEWHSDICNRYNGLNCKKNKVSIVNLKRV